MHLPLLLLIVINYVTLAYASRILLVPFGFPSHVATIAHIGDALTNNGHDVYIYLPEKFKVSEWLEGLSIKRITYKHTVPDFLSQPDNKGWDEAFQKIIQVSLKEEFRMNQPAFIGLCDNMLSDTDGHDKLKKLKFDLAIVDSLQLNRCAHVLPYILDIPQATLYTNYEPWLSRNPSPPSAIPFIMSPLYSEKMTFWERFINLMTMIEYAYMPNVATMDDRFVKDYAKNKPFVTINYLAGKSLLWLLDNDMLLDYPRPLMPNEVMIGGLATKPARPLPAELEKFMSSASHGVVLVSFGSSDTVLPLLVQEKLFSAFARLKQQVLWRVSKSIKEGNNVPKNILLMEWLPQNDLLGHNNTKVFITHCGANGQFEALYHGVPMIGIPMFGDQPYNNKRLDNHKFGIGLSRILDFTEEELYNAIMEVIENPIYKDNIKRASAVVRSRPDHPKQRAAYWIEHVLRHGGQHLRSYALDMPWYQYLMLDLAAFVLFVSILLLVFITVVCKKLIFNTNSKTKTE